MAELEFEEILPFVEGEGDTGKTAREKINRNFTKIEPLANVGAEMQQLRQDVSDDLEQLHDDVEEMVDKTTSLFGYYNCSTAGATAAKTVQATGYVLTNGGNIRIKMTHANTASSGVTLQIGSAAAKDLYYNDSPVTDENTWEDNETIVVYYDGTKYLATNSLGGSNGDAENVHYDNTESGLSATNVQDALDSIADKTNRLTTLDNLNTNLVIDPETTVEQGFYSEQGVLSTTGVGPNFNHTDFIPVEYGKTYRLYAPTSDGTQGNARTVAAFNDSKVALANAGGQDVSVYTIPNSNVKYIIITGHKNGSKKLFGCFEGENAQFKEWMEEETHQLQYNDGISFEDKDDDTLVNKGDVEAALTPLQEGIEEFQDVKDVTDMFEKYSDVSPNLVVNPATTVTQGSYYTHNAVLYNGEAGINFACTDFIPVEYGKKYTVYAPRVDEEDLIDGIGGGARFISAFDENKVGINGAGVQKSKQYTVSNSNVKYIVISGSSNSKVGNENAHQYFGCFEGENITFEKWYESTQVVLMDAIGDYESKPLKSVVTKADVIQAIEDSKEQDVSSEGKMQFRYEAVATMSSLVNNLPAIKIYLANAVDNYMLITLDKNRTSYYGGNHIFNFIAIKYNGVSSTVGDDVPPLMYYTSGGSLNDYGGNHANAVTRLTAPNHDLNNTDIGKTFAHSGGFNVVLLRVVDSDNIIISKDADSPTTVPNGTITINNTEFAINGTNTGTPYLCPVEQQNFTQTILLNGNEEVTEDGDYTCDYLDIVEEYDVNMPTEIIGVIKARVGSEDEPSYETQDSFFHIRNTYRFLPNMGCLIFKTFTALTNINILACLGTQSTFPFGWKIGNNSIGTYIYLPNSTHNESTITPTSANGFRSNENNYVSPTSWDNTIYLVVDSNTWADANNPVNRVVCITPPDAASQCGYAVGYDRSMGVGKSLGNFTDKPLNIAKLGKIYPYSIAGREVVNGDTFTIVMYRMLFRPDLQPEGRICEYHYELNGKLVVYLDYSSGINDVIVIDEKWDNKPIEVVESRNVTLLTDMYNGGIRVRSTYVNGETSFMVVRVG